MQRLRGQVYLVLYQFNSFQSITQYFFCYNLLLFKYILHKISNIHKGDASNSKIQKISKSSIVSNFINKEDCKPELQVFYLNLLIDMNMHLFVEEEN